MNSAENRDSSVMMSATMPSWAMAEKSEPRSD
jgi:hypothetical protein